jgi:hypothetical protein
MSLRNLHVNLNVSRRNMFKYPIKNEGMKWQQGITIYNTTQINYLIGLCFLDSLFEIVCTYLFRIFKVAGLCRH